MWKRFGFTMIELLIVIAVLGILAVAVLAAINPIEQINRGRDTGSRSDAEQLISGIDRYYASKGYYPWTTGADSLNTATFTGANPTFVQLDVPAPVVGQDGEDMFENLTNGQSAELKGAFTARISKSGYNYLSIYNDGNPSSSTYLCFLPKSNSFREEAWDRCSNTDHTGLNVLPDDFPAEACPAGGTCATAATLTAATGCYICLP